MIYETDTNRVLVWDNAAWVMIADTDSPSGLELVKTQTVGTTVSSVTVSDTFSSTWDNYRITYTGGAGSVASAALSIQLGSTTTDYYSSTIYFGYTSTDGGNSLGVADNNDAKWLYVGNASTGGAKLSMDLFCPNIATRTTFSAAYNEFGTANAGHTSGYLNNSTQYTSFVMSTSGGTITGGTIRVYGYRNSI
jgi:hypothetical protein